jgi:hypothetical protein
MARWTHDDLMTTLGSKPFSPRPKLSRPTFATASSWPFNSGLVDVVRRTTTELVVNVRGIGEIIVTAVPIRRRPTHEWRVNLCGGLRHSDPPAAL